MEKKRTVGIYDSGIGGLPVANLVLRSFPRVDLVYLADNVHFPLGDKREEEILPVLRDGLRVLEDRGCDDIVIACNTASIVYEKNRDRFSNTNVLPVTRPLLEMIQNSGASQAVLYGTTFTVESGYYQEQISRIAPDLEVRAVDHQDWVQLIECSSRLEDHPIHGNGLTKETDLLILACTHFHHLLREIVDSYTFDKQVIDSADCIADSAVSYLSSNGMLVNESGSANQAGDRHFFFTDSRPVSPFARTYDWEYLRGERIAI